MTGLRRHADQAYAHLQRRAAANHQVLNALSAWQAYLWNTCYARQDSPLRSKARHIHPGQLAMSQSPPQTADLPASEVSALPRCIAQHHSLHCPYGTLIPSPLSPFRPACSSRARHAHAQARKVSTSDIQLVQNLIERCLQMYLSQREVIATLQSQAKIEPGFTGLVWQVQLPPCNSLLLCRHSCSDSS